MLEDSFEKVYKNLNIYIYIFDVGKNNTMSQEYLFYYIVSELFTITSVFSHL